MAERNDTFWLDREKKLKKFEAFWFQNLEGVELEENLSSQLRKKDYSMAQDLDGDLEKVVGNRLLLAGPIVDSFLSEIGKAMHEKLRRSHLTGLAPPITTFMPIQVFNFFSTLCVGYGADIKKTPKKIVMFLDKEDGATKLFHPKRFDGTYYLCKRKFEKKANKVSEYAGCAKVVVSLYTPIKFEFVIGSNKMNTSLFIQRYDSQDFSVDKSLQALMNQDIHQGQEEQSEKVEEK